jgi:hypothetical protein
MTLKIRKIKKIHDLKCWMSSFESFFCNVLYGGLGIGKLQFLIKKKFFSRNFFPIFGHQNPGSGLDPDWIRIGSGSGSVFSLKCWIRSGSV